jgi:hypothetical protein
MISEGCSRPMVASYSKQVRSIHSDEPHFAKPVGKLASRVPLDEGDGGLYSKSIKRSRTAARSTSY